MTDKEKLESINMFLKSHKLGVISTVTMDGKPESAVIGFSETGNFEIIFGTFNTSRKYINIKNNPQISLVVGWDEGKTVQLEGEAIEATDEQVEEFKKIHLAKIPSAVKYINHTEEVFFAIKPKWVRYSDWAYDPVESFEVYF